MAAPAGPPLTPPWTGVSPISELTEPLEPYQGAAYVCLYLLSACLSPGLTSLFVCEPIVAGTVCVIDASVRPSVWGRYTGAQ